MKTHIPSKSIFFLLWFACQVVPCYAETTTSSISGLLSSGQDVTCSYQTNDADGAQSGTFYVAQNKMRGDILVSNPQQGQMPMHMVRDGEWMYTWGDSFGAGQGMKMNVAQASAQASAHHQGPDMDKPVQMDCNPWSVDNSKFNIPTDVQFNDLSAMLGGPGGMDMGAMQCAACQQVPAEERDQCLQMFGCS